MTTKCKGCVISGYLLARQMKTTFSYVTGISTPQYSPEIFSHYNIPSAYKYKSMAHF